MNIDPCDCVAEGAALPPFPAPAEGPLVFALPGPSAAISIVISCIIIIMIIMIIIIDYCDY